MKRRRVGRAAPRPWGKGVSPSRGGTEQGFTLIELLITSAIVPIIAGALAVSLFSVFSLHTGVSTRIADSADAQVVSATFESDVQSVSMITTSSSATNPSPCGSGTGSQLQLLGLEWNLNPATLVYQTEVSYSEVNNTTLVRYVCTNTSSGSTVTSTTVIVHDLPPGAGVATISCEATTALTTQLTGGIPSGTTLNVGPLPVDVNSGDLITVGSVENTPTTFTATAFSHATTATTISIASTPPLVTYPVGTPVVDQTWSTNNNCNASNWITAPGILGVTLGINVPEQASSLQHPAQPTSYSYHLTAVPRSWTAASGGALPGGSPPLLLIGNDPLLPNLSCEGSGGLNVDGEIVLDRSISTPAADEGGSGSITATSFYTVAGTPGALPALWDHGSGQINSAEPNSTGPPLADPYAGLSPPSTLGMPINPSSYTLNGVVHYLPGHYTLPLSISTSSQVILDSGIYVFDAGIASTGSGNITSATGGVLFYVDGGAVALTGSGNVSLSALSPPPSGLPANLLLWQASVDSLAVGLVGSGNVGLIGGTIYAPGAVIGTTASGNFNATTVMAAGLDCTGSGNINIGFPQPTVTNVSPNSGSTSGGTQANAVTISGSGFVPGATVWFGNNKLNTSNVTVNSNNSISVIYPHGSAGVVDVTVQTPGGTSATTALDQFTYH